MCESTLYIRKNGFSERNCDVWSGSLYGTLQPDFVVTLRDVQAQAPEYLAAEEAFATTEEYKQSKQIKTNLRMRNPKH